MRRELQEQGELLHADKQSNSYPRPSPLARPVSFAVAYIEAEPAFHSLPDISMEDKENVPLESNSLERSHNSKRGYHPLRQERQAPDELDDPMNSPKASPSSLDDVFQTGSSRQHTTGRSPFAIFRKPSPNVSMHGTQSPNVSTNDTQSWKEKFSGALSLTGLRRSSKKKDIRERQSDLAEMAADSPPLPEFLRHMISGFSSASTSESGDAKRVPSDTTSERLSRFFFHQSSRSPSPLAPDNEHVGLTPDNIFLLSTQAQPFRPAMRERVSTIADRKITEAITRDSLGGVLSQPYGMSSHLSLHDPDFPISECRSLRCEACGLMHIRIVLHSPLRGSAGASAKVTRPLFKADLQKSKPVDVHVEASATQIVSGMMLRWALLCIDARSFRSVKCFGKAAR